MSKEIEEEIKKEEMKKAKKDAAAKQSQALGKGVTFDDHGNLIK